MKITIKLIGVVLLLLTVVVSFGSDKRVIYIAPNGSDSNLGTEESPLASLTGARNLIREIRTNDSIVVKIASGDYFITTPLELTSEDSNIIIFEGAEERPTLYGGVSVTGWEVVSDKLWRAYTPQVKEFGLSFEQLFINGKRATRARTPNIGFYTVKDVKENIIDVGNRRIPDYAIQTIYLNSDDISLLNNENPNALTDGVVTLYHKWDVTRKYIDHFSCDSSSINIRGRGMQPWNRIDSKSKYYIENIYSALDSPGEWFLKDDGYLYYSPLEDEDIESTTAYIPVSDKFITIRGDKENSVNNKIFKNINFKVSAFNMSRHGDDPMQAAAYLEASIMVDYAKNIVFENCELANIGMYGIWFRRECTECKINHSYIHDIGGGGVKIGDVLFHKEDIEVSSNNIVNNSIIRDGGHLFPSAVGVIIFNAKNCEITHNEIANFRYSGVSIGWMWGYKETEVWTTLPDKFGDPIWKKESLKSPATGNIIAYNHIHYLGWGELSDMGGVYIVSEATGTMVNNNTIHHIYSDIYGGWGLYTDEASTNVTMENNLVYACKNSGFHQHYGKENTIRNNIFAFNMKGQVQFTRVEEHQSFEFKNNIIYTNCGEMLLGNFKDANIDMDSNCYWNTNSSDPLFTDINFEEWKKLKDKNSILADPLFVNAENFNFNFKSLSVVQKIGFKPFNYSESGVYGSKEWRELATFDKNRAALFNKIVADK